MRKTIPRVVYSGLYKPGRFYVVLRYTLKGTTDDRRVVMVAHEKYDVTHDVLKALEDYRRDHQRRRRTA